MPKSRVTKCALLLGLVLSFLVVPPMVATGQAAVPVPVTRTFTAPIEPIPEYDAQKICDPIPRPGVVATKQLLLKTYGDRVIYIPRYGCSGISEHHEGRALDWMISVPKPAEKATADSFIAWLQKTDSFGNKNAMVQRMGIMYIIWNNRMWRSYDTAKGWTNYKNCAARTSTAYDTECHRDHVHISFTWDGAMAATSFYTGRVLDPGAPCGSIGGSGVASPAATDQHFIAIKPSRLVDSAKGIGVATAQRCRLMWENSASPGQLMEVDVTGRAGVPSSGVSAVALSLRVGTNAPTSVYVWPTGASKPSTVQAVAGAGGDGRATVVVPVGKDGRITLATTLGAQWVNADVVGYYTADGGTLFNAVNSWRAINDTVLGPGQVKSFKLGGKDGIPTSGVDSLTLSVTTTNATKSGALRIHAFGGIAPGADSAVYRIGTQRTATVITGASDNGSITISNMSTTATVHVNVDVNGWSGATGDLYSASFGHRILDTAAGKGASGVVTTGRTISFSARGVSGVPASASAVAMQLYATNPVSGSAFRAFAHGTREPDGWQFTSERAAPTAQLVIAPVGSDGKVSVVGISGSSNLRADVVGWWTSTTRSPSPTPTPTPTVNPAAYALSTALSPSFVVLPTQSTITGWVLPAKVSSGKRVVIQRWINHTWKSVGSATIATTGKFTYGTQPVVRGSYLYRVWKPSDGCVNSVCTTRGAVSPAFTLNAAVRYAVGIGVVDKTITKGSLAQLQGGVSPAVAGSLVTIQRYTGGKWKSLGTAVVRSSGRYSYATRPATTGGFLYRAVKFNEQCAQTICLLQGAVSRTIVVTVG